MHPACPNKEQNHLQNNLLRRTQFCVRKTFSKPASLKRASLVAFPVAISHKASVETKTFFKDFHLFETRSRNRKENANKPNHKKQLKLQSSRLTMSRFRSQNALPFSSAGWFVPLLDPVWIRPYFNRNHLTRWHQQPIRVR